MYGFEPRFQTADGKCLLTQRLCVVEPFAVFHFTTSKLARAGSKTPQRFTAYGAMVGAPLFNDNLVNTRKDYTYMEPTTGASGIVSLVPFSPRL